MSAVVTTEQITQHLTIYPSPILSAKELRAKLTRLSNLSTVSSVEVFQNDQGLLGIDVNYLDVPDVSTIKLTEHLLEVMVTEKRPPARAQGRTRGHKPEEDQLKPTHA